jgi:hypothetical protein
MKVMPVMESDAAAVEGHAPVKRAAWNCSAAGSNAAGMKCAAAWSNAATMEAATAAMAAPAAVATTSASASAATASVTAAHFDDRRAGGCARDRRSTGIDQRQRASVLT